MAADRANYQAWDVASQVEKVMAISSEYKEAYKNEINMTANKFADLEKGFAPSKLFWTDADLYYSEDLFAPQDEYIWEFLENDERAPYRGNYKRTEVGLMYPELVKENAKPGDTLVLKKRNYAPIWQDESAPLEDWHVKNMVDWQMFDLTHKFLNGEDYFRITNAVLNAIREGNSMVEKCIVDTFLTSVLGIYSYPQGHPLFPIFSGSDDFVPDDNYSKDARQFFLKAGAIRTKLAELIKYTQKYYVARESYLTNLHTHEVIGQALDKTIPEWNKKLVDRSDKTKALAAVREWFLDKDTSQKYSQVGYSLRRMSLDALSSAIFGMLDRLTTRNAQNWCGHKFGEENKTKEGIYLKAQPENLLVFMNNFDLADMLDVKGSSVVGPFTESSPIASKLAYWTSRGVRVYGCKFILPSMAIAMDRKCFRLVQYFEKTYDQFHIEHLIESKVNHMFKKLVLYRKVVCNTLELAKGQKFALPIAWGSNNLPIIREPQG